MIALQKPLLVGRVTRGPPLSIHEIGGPLKLMPFGFQVAHDIFFFDIIRRIKASNLRLAPIFDNICKQGSERSKINHLLNRLSCRRHGVGALMVAVRPTHCVGAAPTSSKLILSGSVRCTGICERYSPR